MAAFTVPRPVLGMLCGIQMVGYWALFSSSLQSSKPSLELLGRASPMSIKSCMQREYSSRVILPLLLAGYRMRQSSMKPTRSFVTFGDPFILPWWCLFAMFFERWIARLTGLLSFAIEHPGAGLGIRVMVFYKPYRTFYFWTFWITLTLELCGCLSVSKKVNKHLQINQYIISTIWSSSVYSIQWNTYLTN